MIADAKRGDIDVTATAYAQAFFGETPTPFGAVPGLGADALTVNPLLGADSLAPFVDGGARARRRGCSCSCGPRTRAPPTCRISSSRTAARSATGSPRLVAELGAASVGSSGLADVGAVVGATAPSGSRRCAS